MTCHPERRDLDGAPKGCTCGQGCDLTPEERHIRQENTGHGRPRAQVQIERELVGIEVPPDGTLSPPITDSLAAKLGASHHHTAEEAHAALLELARLFRHRDWERCLYDDDLLDDACTVLERLGFEGLRGQAIPTPLVCVCPEPSPDAIGECATCHRCVPSMSWHEGVPG